VRLVSEGALVAASVVAAALLVLLARRLHKGGDVAHADQRPAAPGALLTHRAS